VQIHIPVGKVLRVHALLWSHLPQHWFQCSSGSSDETERNTPPSIEPRVLHLISSSGFLGAENVVLELADQIRCAGIPVTIAVFKNSRNLTLSLPI